MHRLVIFQLSDLHKQSVQQSLDRPDTQYQHYSGIRLAPVPARVIGRGSVRRTAHRSVMALRIDTGEYLHEISPPPSPTSPTGRSDVYTPRRVKLLNFWARTRLFQKLMMFCVVVWISLILHKAGIVQHLTTANVTSTAAAAAEHDDDAASSLHSLHVLPTVHDAATHADDVIQPPVMSHDHHHASAIHSVGVNEDKQTDKDKHGGTSFDDFFKVSQRVYTLNIMYHFVHTCKWS